MDRILYLQTLEEIRTMTDPYRVKIQVIFAKNGEAMTVKEVADIMGEAHGKVYYHIKKMIKVGALEVERTEKINGITAKYLRLTFDRIEVKEDHGEDLKGSMAKVISDYFDEQKQAMIQGTKWMDKSLNPVEQELALVSSKVYFDQASHKNFMEDLNGLIEKYAKKDPGLTEKTIFYAIYSNKEKASKN